jgi:large subunit ribosomal protein L6
MSRVAKTPVPIPAGVEVKLQGQQVSVKGAKGRLEYCLHDLVLVEQQEQDLLFSPRNGGKASRAMAGTMRVLVSNMVKGVSDGFEKKLELNGVGYRAKVTGNTVNLTLGFSHPVDYELPQGVSAVTPTQTEIVISGIDKQQVGQVAAEIRGFRPPEPYKGKGVRYSGEYVRRKETKKK